MDSIDKKIEEGRTIIKVNEDKDLTVEEMNYFRDEFIEILKTKGLNESIFNLIGNVYYMGIANGMCKG